MAEELFNTEGTPAAGEPATEETPAVETGESGEASVEGTEGTPAGGEAAEIAYSDFTVPEGFEAPNEEFLALTKELGLNQESVQKVVDYYTGKFVPGVQQAYETSQKQEIEKRNTEWEAQSTKDIGKEGIDRARLAIKQFATPELTSFLNETGLGSHPVLVKLFADIGNKMSESTLITGKSVTPDKRAADILFG
jgi:hypothetical protein